jgi:HEPN domain-containing protein
MRAETFERNRNIVGTLAAEADSEGIVVYGSPKALASMKASDPRARWAVVERWLAVAEIDRQTVAACMAVDPPLRASAAFHCPQAVEKLLKGFLVLAGKRFRKTHSLAQQGAAAQASFPDIADLVAAAENWTAWAIAYRYPLAEGPDKAEPDDDELQRALVTIDALAARLRRPQS